MQIFVNMVSGKVLTLEVEGNHTVEEVHDMIESAEGVPRLL
jgi:predicted ABC-class ATPase